MALLPDRGAVVGFRADLVERAARAGTPGIFDGGVTTFEGLAETILALPGAPSGCGEEGPATALDREELTLPEEESLLLVHLKNHLPARLAERIESPGYRGALLQWVAELREACLGSSEVGELLAGLERSEPRLEILRNFLQIISDESERAGFSFRATLPLLAGGMIAEGTIPWAPPALLVVDGFHRFSPVRLEFLQSIVPLIPEVWITMPSPEGEEEWSEEALNLAASSLVERFDLEEVHLDARPAEREMIFLGGSDREEEMERIGREILRGCSDEERKFEDHIILFRNMNSYRESVESSFRRLSIPCHAQFQLSLAATQAGRSLLDMIALARRGISRSNLEPMLKNRLFDADPDLTDRVTSRWRITPEPDDPSKIVGRNDVTEAGYASERVEPFVEAVGEIRSARGARVIAALLESWVELTARSFRFELPAVADGALLGASFERVALLLQRSARLFSRCDSLADLPVDDVLDLLSEEIRRAQFSYRSGGEGGVRLDDYRHGENVSAPVVFLAGLAESEVPRPWQSGSFWNDTDRAALNETGQFRVSDRSSHRAEERFLFRRAFTRASEKIYLTTRAFNSSGKELAESPFRREIREEPGALPSRDLGNLERYASPRSIVVKEDLLPYLVSKLDPSANDPDGLALAASLAGRFSLRIPRRAKDFRDVLHLSGHPRFLPWAALKNEFSVTELEDFALCPWRYLSRHILLLNEAERPAKFALSPGLEGEVIHELMEMVVKGEGVMDDLLPALFEKRRGEFPERAPHRLALEQWRVALGDLIETDEQFRELHGWQSTHFELRFGKREGNGVMLDELTVVSGRIDRLDIAKGDRLAVVDYKRSAPAPGRFHDDLAQGLSLALPIYLRAAADITGLVPAGAFLLAARGGGRVGFAARTGMEEGLFPKPRANQKAIRILEEGELENVEKGALDRAHSIVGEIRRGSFPVNPASDRVCNDTGCPYGDLCRVVLAAREDRE